MGESPGRQATPMHVRDDDRAIVFSFQHALWIVALGGLIVATVTCTHAPDDQQLVGDPIAPETRASVAAGEAEVTEALSSFILETDREICRRAEGRRAARQVSQAISEAYIELTRAVEKAEQ